MVVGLDLFSGAAVNKIGLPTTVLVLRRVEQADFIRGGTKEFRFQCK